MRAYSQDLRERVAHAVAQGLPKTTIARTFCVSVASVKKYAALQRTNHSLAPGKSSGRPKAITPDQYADLERQLAENHEATLAEHVALWEASHGVRMCLSTMFRTIRRLDWTYKKRHWQPASRTSASARRSATRLPLSPPTALSPSMKPPRPLP